LDRFFSILVLFEFFSILFSSFNQSGMSVQETGESLGRMGLQEKNSQQFLARRGKGKGKAKETKHGSERQRFRARTCVRIHLSTTEASLLND